VSRPPLRMPAEWAPHERTLMAWPARRALWGAAMDQAKRDYAQVARAIARFEPVLMLCPPGDAREVHDLCGAEVEVVELPIDDSWMRDAGPIYVVGDGRRVGVDFAFNGWGGKFAPWDDDAALARRLLAHLGHERRAAPFVLEGGAIAVDGEGTLVTTEQCLLNPNRNPGMSRAQIEAGLREQLGVERIVWLGRGLVEDRDTDGHVDMACAFVAPGRVLLQTVRDPDNPNAPHAAENRRRLERAGLAVEELDVLPYIEHGGERLPAPYVNHYLCNGGVIVPLAGGPDDVVALERIGACHPTREIAGVPGRTIFSGGGGVHCITQQVPAVGGEGAS
jgi:agmatine deiminase